MSGKILVHIRAPLLTLSGYGAHAREVVNYLLDDGRFEVFIESCNWGQCPYIHKHPRLKEYYNCILKYDQFKDKVEFDLSVHVTIPNEFHRRGKFNIGVTAGIEVDRISMAWVEKCNEMDLIIVPSEFSKKIITGTVYEWENKRTGERGQNKVVKPVHVIPEYFEEPEKESVDLKLDTKTNFLHVSQWGNKGGYGEDRKNVADLIKLFLETFKDNKDVGLVLKLNVITNSKRDYYETLRRVREIKKNFKGAKCKLYLIHDTMSDGQLWGLYNHPDIKAFVSLTHGEGFGRPMLEAAFAGLPVIATNWSGHVDFLENKKGFIPLDFSMVEVPECQVWPGVIEKESKWAKVDDENVKKRLRKFASSPSLIQKQAEKHVSWLKDNFSKEAVEVKWSEFFDQLVSPESKTSNTELSEVRPKTQKELITEQLSQLVEESENKKVIYIMPQSAGDVLISTAIVNSLIQSRHSEDDFYFATKEQYAPLLKGLEDKFGIKVIPHSDPMLVHELTSEVWDYVYNPGVNLQFQFSNWLLGNGEYSVRMLEEMAKQCNLSPAEVKNYCYESSDPKEDYGLYCTFSPGGIKSAKSYKYWDDVLENLKEMVPGLRILQTGLPEEKHYEGAEDCRGLSYSETVGLIEHASFHIGVDTFTAHAAAATDTPHVILYGSTSAHTVTPVLLGKNKLQVLLETSDRHGCKNPCYKDECTNLKKGRNCVSEIHPQDVCNAVRLLIEKMNEEEVSDD